MTRKSIEAYASVIMAFGRQLQRSNILLVPSGSLNIERYFLEYEPELSNYGLRNTGARSIRADVSIPLHGPLLFYGMTMSKGPVPSDLLIDFQARVCASWTTIGGHLEDIV